MRKLLDRGNHQPDLLVATLLHDVGKLRYRLNPVERAMIVLVGAVTPKWTQRWGNLPAGGWENVRGWRRAFVVAEQHAMWGAEMARQAEVSPLAEALIREHHHPQGNAMDEEETGLLQQLWSVDNES